MKKTYKISIDCANCANNAEAAASKIQGVKSLTVNFMTQKMTVEFEDGADAESVMKAVEKACSRIDEDFEIEF